MYARIHLMCSWIDNNDNDDDNYEDDDDVLGRLCFRTFVISYLIGEINEIIFEAMLMKKPGLNAFSKDGDFINGLQSHEALVQRHVPLGDAKVRIIIST